MLGDILGNNELECIVILLTVAVTYCNVVYLWWIKKNSISILNVVDHKI